MKKFKFTYNNELEINKTIIIEANDAKEALVKFVNLITNYVDIIGVELIEE